MSKKRGNYYQYLYNDNVKVPRSANSSEQHEMSTTDTAGPTDTIDQLSDTGSATSQAYNESPIDFSDNHDISESSSSSDESDDGELIEIVKDFTNEEEVAAAYLSAFYAGKMTQKAFKLQLELTKKLYNPNLPSSFDAMRRAIKGCGKVKDEFYKIWYCSNCQAEVKLDYSKQRSCKICKTRLVETLFSN
jgi:hypothetical protein